MTLEEHLNLIGGCSDGGCIVIEPKGMHTNGGCRCNRDPYKMVRLVYALKKEIERLNNT